MIIFTGEDVPEEERLNSKDQRSIEQYDNTPIIDNLPPGGGDVSNEERKTFEEDIRNLYKQLDDKVRLSKKKKINLSQTQINLLFPFCRTMRSTNTANWLRSLKSKCWTKKRSVSLSCYLYIINNKINWSAMMKKSHWNIVIVPKKIFMEVSTSFYFLNFFNVINILVFS